MKCVVTGGAGFLGSHLVDLLVDEGFQVVVIDNLATGRAEYVNPLAQFVKADVRDLAVIMHYARDAELFFHLAALPRIQPSFDAPVEHELVNVIGTLNCLEAVKGARLRKFVYSSSSATYGNTMIIPTPEDAPPQLLNPYALQKYAAEQYALILGKRFEIPVIALRYFNVYGPRSFNPQNPFNAYSNVVGIFADQWRRGVPLTVTGSGEQRRDFVHVTDVAQANLAAALSDKAYAVYNVGCGMHHSINEVAAKFSPNITYLPERKGEARVTVAAITNVQRDLSWIPRISLDEGIRQLKSVREMRVAVAS